MAILYNLVREYTSTIGYGNVSLDGAVFGHLSFIESGVQDGDVVSYSLIDGENVEVGRGTYDASYNWLTRDEILNSTNGGSPINLSGNAHVLITALKQDFDHDALINFISDEHIPHSSINIIAGQGLAGGGTIDSDVTLSLDSSQGLIWEGSSTFDSVLIREGLHVGQEGFIGSGAVQFDYDFYVLGNSTFSGEAYFGSLLTTLGGVHIGGTSDPDAPREQDPSYPLGNLIVEGNVSVKSGLYVNKTSYFTESLVSNKSVVSPLLVVQDLLRSEGTTILQDITNAVGGLRVGDLTPVDGGILSVVDRVGIGTTAPETSLHIINGGIRIEGISKELKEILDEIANIENTLLDPELDPIDRDSLEDALAGLLIEKDTLAEEIRTILDTTTSSLQFYSGQKIVMGVANAPSRQVELITQSSAYGISPFFTISVGTDNIDDSSPLERLRITDRGLIGINTASPEARLEIKSTSLEEFIRLSLEDFPAYWDISLNNLGYLTFSTYPDSNPMLVLGRDKVGINKPNPSHTLHILGDLFIEDLDGIANISSNNSLIVSADVGDLSLKAQNNILLTPIGNKVIISDGTIIKSNNYISDTVGWGISGAGVADFRELRVNELRAKSFIADQEQAIAGSQLLTKSSAVLAEPFVAPSPDGRQDLVVSGFKGYPNFAVFEDNDFIRIRTMTRLTDGTYIADCWGVVTLTSIDVANNIQRYSFKRSYSEENSIISGLMQAGTVVDKGALAIDYGRPGAGYIESTVIG